MDNQLDSKQIKGIIRRRQNSFIYSFLGVFIAAVIVALLLPATYRSTATILIENQMIPEEYVQTTITSYVEERLASITQQIMSRSRLLEIIERFSLYEEMKDRYTSEEIVEKMRNNIDFEPNTEEVVDRRTGRATEATIFFTLSFEGEVPSKVQRIANVLASLYLELNLQTREQLASNTTVFLESELSQLRDQVDAFEESISQFKRAHLGELPEYNTANLQALQQLNTQLDRIDSQINSLEERKILLEGQLASVDPLTTIMMENGQPVMDPSDRLTYLRMELISMGSRLSEDHPDYKILEKEIEELEKHTGLPNNMNDKIKRLSVLEAKLAEVSGTKGEEHPDIIGLKKEIAVLSEDIKSEPTAGTVKDLTTKQPDNPIYINIQTQIASADNDIRGLKERKIIMKDAITDYQKRLANSPIVEKEYNKLLLDYEMTKSKYSEVSAKLMEAKVAQGMEETQRGERFTIIDPAQFPEKPASPNRLAILFIGLVLALGAGTGMAAVMETIDNSIKTPEELVSLTGAPVLSVINLIETSHERRSRWRKRIIWIIASIIVIGTGILAFHHLVMPIEVFSAKLERKVNKF